MKKRIFAATATLIATTTVAAFAHSGATGIVKERMDAMGAMGKATETLTKIMRGELEYDAAKVKENAATIKSHAGESLTKLFPEGSNEHPSEALPAIWTDWDRFVELAMSLETLSAGLEAAAANGLMAGGDKPSGDMGSMMGTDGGMMGGGMMGGHVPNAEMLAQMPADAVFNMMAQTCSACHSDFRVDKD